MLQRYLDRPDESFWNGKFALLNGLCYVDILSFYYITPSANKDHWQPIELKDELLEVNAPIIYPPVIPLISSKEKLKCRKVPPVLHQIKTECESYVHHLLHLFYPFRNETELEFIMPPIYTNKLAEPDITDISNRNRSMVVDKASLHYKKSVFSNSEHFRQGENEEI